MTDHEEFWIAVAIVAALAVLIALRMVLKRRALSRAQRAEQDAGVTPPDLAAPAPPPLPREEDCAGAAPAGRPVRLFL